jgi:hypothetical protein
MARTGTMVSVRHGGHGGVSQVKDAEISGTGLTTFPQAPLDTL